MSPSSPDGTHFRYVLDEDGANTLRQSSPGLSDNGDANAEEHPGDYSTRMEELFDDREDGPEPFADEDEDEDEDEGFVYTGVDAPPVTIGYIDQLREVLGSELTDDELNAHEVGQPLAQIEDDTCSLFSNQDSLVCLTHLWMSFVSSINMLFLQQHEVALSNHPPSTSSMQSTTSIRIESNGSSGGLKLSRPFLPPSVSRLRSFTPQSSGLASNGSGGSRMASNSHLRERMTPSPSHLSSMSRRSSRSNLHSASGQTDGLVEHTSLSERDVFKWTKLSNISEHMYNSLTQKLSSVLGAPMLGTPTVFTVTGLICIGTDQGKICVYDFKQRLICICGNEARGMFLRLSVDSLTKNYIQGKTIGAVTAVALSHDHTYVASGHASGHIQLFDLKNPKVPTRFVPPTTLQDVASGRKEGHIEGSRIVSIDFIAARHTAIVSSDDRGLAFYHSLGKMLFVEAPDILRILGQYQSDTLPQSISYTTPSLIPDTSLPRRRKSRYAILATVPLPLGTSTHPTDQYNIIAMLTPSKLVVVGLKPTPRTWFKCPRGAEEGLSYKQTSAARGALAWCPSVLPAVLKPAFNDSPTNDTYGMTSASPMLVFTWGCALRLIRVDEYRSKETAHNFRTGKHVEVEVGRIVYHEAGRWSAEGDIFAVQWLNVHCRTEVRVGTLLTWADRILAFVEEGDFLSAIDLARSYYTGVAPGNRNGLPDDPILRKEVIGGKMRDLMVASASYAFSEDRMTDGTHSTPDHRGVDRTSLFEGLVSVSCRASIALDDFEFLFEDLFQRFDDTGISKIFVRQLEPFVLNNDMHYVPPRITQRLVALHEEDNRPDRIERIIWHIDPACLDIHQTILLCQRYQLYDALIYVYTRALCDFVAPLVDLLGLIRQVHQFRRARSEDQDKMGPEDEVLMETIILNAYKVYPYLSNILSGLSYPSEETLPEDDAQRAKKEVYSFLFFGRSSVWPPGEGSRLVLTSDDDGGAEPTYPYVRQLLRFDAESFLHSLDIAFEDSFLNDESRGTNRLVIVRILMEILSTGDLSTSDSTFVNIFIARNVPKYPQFLPIPPSALYDIIIGLAEDPDLDTREDRQLAAEYLLSAYNPHNSEQLIGLFESAGFYRILRSWHRQEHRWGPLLSAYLEDRQLHPSEALLSVDEVLTVSTHANNGSISFDIHTSISAALPQLLHRSLVDTAHLLDKHCPDLHEVALQHLANDDLRFYYLRGLLGPSEQDEEVLLRSYGPSRKISGPLRQLYISLQCRLHPEGLIETLKYLPEELVDWNSTLLTCETEKVYDAIVWATNQRGEPQEALRKAEAYQKRLTQRILTSILESSTGQTSQETRRDVDSLVSIAAIGIDMCLEHSKAGSRNKVPLEDIWFQLLSSTIHSVQTLSSSQPEPPESYNEWDDILVTLRALVHRIFASLVSVTTTQAVSFPSLFKRLIDSAPSTMHSQYTEFRTILTGMLESYRSEGDMLVITKHLVDRDMFETMAEIVQERERGWSPFQSACARCQKPILANSPLHQTGASPLQIVVFRTGLVYHNICAP
ncbi:hypothetical protein H0H87_004092 [Tephrocybe sp. NHM501043]|nr:hypothetical protein H0H87_004092 [Tephrocybe sp. NHM501043]